MKEVQLEKAKEDYAERIGYGNWENLLKHTTTIRVDQILKEIILDFKPPKKKHRVAKFFYKALLRVCGLPFLIGLSVVSALINLIAIIYAFVVYGGEFMTFHKKLRSTTIKDYFNALDRSKEIKEKEVVLDQLIENYEKAKNEP